jgi:hypothetical protein
MSRINDFKGKLIGGGSRANQFKVEIPAWPGFVSGDSELFQFMCTATTTPASNVGEIPVPFRGRNLYVAGDRTFDTWTTTILNDTEFATYESIEAWLEGINNVATNKSAKMNPATYQVDAYVTHLDRNDAIKKTWKLIGVFPTALPGISLSYGDNDTIESFDVTWRYQWYENNISPASGQ